MFNADSQYTTKAKEDVFWCVHYDALTWGNSKPFFSLGRSHYSPQVYVPGVGDP